MIEKIFPSDIYPRPQSLLNIFETVLNKYKIDSNWEPTLDNIYDKKFIHQPEVMDLILKTFSFKYITFNSVPLEYEENFNQYLYENILSLRQHKMSKQTILNYLKYLGIEVNVYVLNTEDYVRYIRVDENEYQDEYVSKPILKYIKLNLGYKMNSGKKFNDTYDEPIVIKRKDNRTYFLEVEFNLTKKYDNGYLWFSDLHSDVQNILEINRFVLTKYFFTFYYKYNFDGVSFNQFTFENDTTISKLDGMNAFNLKTDVGLSTDNGLYTDIKGFSLLYRITNVRYYYKDGTTEYKSLKSLTIDEENSKMYATIDEDFGELVLISATDNGLVTDDGIVTDGGIYRKIPTTIDREISKIVLTNDSDSLDFFEIKLNYLYLPADGRLLLDIEALL